MYVTLRTQLYSRFFFLMIRRPPRSTLDRSSAASDVYKRQAPEGLEGLPSLPEIPGMRRNRRPETAARRRCSAPVSYTHLRAHETVLDLVCRLLLEKKKIQHSNTGRIVYNSTSTSILHRYEPSADAQ